MKNLLLILIASLAMCGSIFAQYESHWSDFSYLNFQSQTPCVAAIEIDGEIVTAGNHPDNWNALEIAFFVGEECRGAGVAFGSYDPAWNYLYNGYVEAYGDPFPIIDGAPVYFNDVTNELVTVKMYDHVNGIEYNECTVTYLGDLYEIRTGAYNDQGWGDPENPIILDFTPQGCPRPGEVTVSDITTSGATVSWTENGTATAWQICLNNDETSLVDINEPYYSIIGLDGEQYTVKVRAICDSGVSAWSAVKTFSLAVPCPAPTLLNVTEITDHSALLTWTENGTATAWQICLNNDETTLVDINEPYYSITGLNGGTQYTVKVRAICDSGVSAWSAVKTFTTAFAQYESHWPDFDYTAFSSQEPLVAAIEIDGEIVTAGNHPDNWNALEIAFFVGEECRGAGVAFGSYDPAWNYLFNGYVEEWGDPFPIIDGAPVYYVNAGEVVTVKMYDHVNGIEYNECTVTYMGDLYEIRTGEENVQGWGDPENPIILDFTPQVCPGPGEVTVSDITTSGATVSWTENGTATAWQICLNNDETSLVDINEPYYSIIGLDGEQYTVKVRAICDSGVSAWSAVKTFSLAVPCPAPTLLNVTEITDHSALLTWTENGTATAWQICLNNDETTLVDINEPYYSIIGLNGGTQYTVKVRAICDSGVSAWSAVKTFTTQDWVGVNPNNYESHWTFNWYDYNSQVPFVCAITIDGQVVTLNTENWSDLEVAAFVTTAEGQEECRGNMMWLTDEYVIEYDDPFLTIDGYPIYYNTPGGTVHFKMYDHANNIEYTECTVTYLGDPYTVTAGIGVVHGWGDWLEPVMLNFTTCLKPTELTASNVGFTSVDLNWRENGTATEWQISLNGDTNNLVTSNSNPFTLTGLTPQTYYTAKVRENCGDSYSGWSNTVSFTTICPVTTIDTLVCTAELPIIWNGLEIFEEGGYTVILTSASGCDSTVTMNLSTKHSILPYFEDFESYTESTTAATGVEPACWELVQEDVPMSDANRPQLYYKSAYAHSGNYSLMLNYRGVYAMPSLSEDIPMNQVHLEMYLRQPRAYYALEVGIWENDDTFVPVATFNNSTTEVTRVECDFSEYIGDGHRIAFRNLNTNGDAYSYNYIDDITLKYAIPAGDAKPCPGHETVTDYDGNVYNTVKIGEQCWMKENLRVTKYEDGKEIPDGNSTSYDIAYHYNPGNDVNNVSTYGLLYNWPAVMHGLSSSDANPSNIQGVCPSGWHVPSISEWDQLNDYVSSVYAYTCGGNIAKSLASTTGWESSDIPGTPGYDQDQNNATGFSALPATCYGYWCGICGGASWCTIGSQTNFWSTTNAPNFSPSAYSPMIIYNIDSLYRHSMVAYNSHAYSVRCVLGEGYNLAAVTTGPVRNITSDQATCGGNVTYDGNTTVTERGVCWSTEPNPTLDYAYSVEGDGTGEFTTQLTDLWPATTYYVRAYATNSMGTVYGEEVSFTTCGGTLALPYSEDFENYTATTAASTGVEPACWELVQEDVEMPENKKPQLYYKSAFAHSGDYSLKMDYRGVYAMPPIEDNLAMKHLHLDMYLRQPNAAYRLQVGVWDDATGTFTPVATFNNSTTGVEHVECDFSNYTGNGRRVAFRNVLVSGANYAYSYNYLDDITLSETEGCELTVEMHSNGNPDWGGSLIRIYTDGSVKEVTLNNAYDDAVTVTVHNGMLDLEWVYNGQYPIEWMSFTVSGPCLYYSTERASYETEYFYSTELSCDGNGTTSIPDFDYWTENVCNNVVVHFENNSTDAEYSVWDFGDWSSSEEDNPVHEYTVSNVYPVTLSVHNVTCDDFSVIRKYIEVNMPEPITTEIDTVVCAAELPTTWYGQVIAYGGTYSTVLQNALGCDSIVNMNFNVVEKPFLHTPDTLVSANEPVTLWAAGSGNFIWTDADGNVIDEGNNITVIPTESTTYYVTRNENSYQENLVVNGDFEQGDTGFGTSYSYGNYGSCGYYYIGHENHEMWSWDIGDTLFDHTSGTGMYMMVDAASYRTAWSQTVDVTPHTNYVFSAWFLTDNQAYVYFDINGDRLNGFNTPQQRGFWERRLVVWNSGDNTTATININTEWASCGGYDFGIDDIEFYEIACEGTESISLTLLPTGDAQPCPSTPTVSDIDGNVYNTVKIGNQCWMKENLKTTHYADGNEIAWGEEASLTTPYLYGPGYEWDDHSWYVGDYGYLYNWAAVMHGANSSTANPSGVQGICPDGWHVPSNAEWAQLTDYVGSVPAYLCGGSNDIAKALALPEGWSWWWDNECGPGYSNENASGFNTTGFSVRPAGSYNGNYSPNFGGNYYTNYNGTYYDFTTHAAFWSSTKSGSLNAWGVQLLCNVSGVYRYYFSKKNAFSVRCVYNETIASVPTVETDNVTFITPTYATCGGNVADDGGIAVTERGVCWSSEHTPTVYDSRTSDGRGSGDFTSILNDLIPNTTYYVRAYATNSTGTGYGQMMSFTTTTCEPITIPYFENFESYTYSQTNATGVQPTCWEVVSEDVALTNATKPQVYYNATYATSGSYTLRMKNRCVYALPELRTNDPVSNLTMTFKLRQPKAVYRLQVGVVDAQGNFTSVKTINNSSTETEDITVDFANYTGKGRRIAFRNTVSSSSTLDYSVNYIDDITLDITPAACGIFELPYSENFDDYTQSTTAETGVEPRCWEVTHEDVALTNATKPQVYYNATYATSGSYTLRMKNRCVYALPELNVDQSVNELTMTFRLRQPKAVYRLQVGVVDAQGNFTSVKTINNSSTETEDITVDFANYTGNGRRIAFRNTVSSSSTLDYSVNYIDNIVLDLTPASCDISKLPYTENFDGYTQSTTAETGVQPNCWEVITEEVALTNATKPQVYYNATYATSGSYTLRMKNRCVYAMPELNVNDPVSSLTMTFKLRQPKAVYRLQVGVVDAQGNFTSVKTINNASTNTEDITVDFANYTGNGRRIAFRNTVSSNSTLDYSVNYIDDITLVRTANNKSGEVTDATAVDARAADRDQVDVVVYPNPTKDVVNVQCTMNNAQCSGIEIVDVYGKIITTVGTRFIASADSPASAQSPVQINVSGLAAGMYFVRVTTDRGVVTKPFVKR